MSTGLHYNLTYLNSNRRISTRTSANCSVNSATTSRRTVWLGVPVPPSCFRISISSILQKRSPFLAEPKTKSSFPIFWRCPRPVPKSGPVYGHLPTSCSQLSQWLQVSSSSPHSGASMSPPHFSHHILCGQIAPSTAQLRFHRPRSKSKKSILLLWSKIAYAKEKTKG